MPENEDKLEHRGRFQAQGGGVEESEPWAQDTPLSVKKAKNLLSLLVEKLKPKDYERRKKQFSKAEKLIEGAGKNGGVFARFSKTFLVKGSKDERVDIEVLSGKAFVEDDD